MKKKTFALATAALALTACAHYEASGPRASATLRPTSGSQVQGKLTFTEASTSSVRVVGEIVGHTPGPKGFHIHERGDCSAPDAKSAGSHFNPGKLKHGPSAAAGHAGDMGNIVFDASGRATVNMVVPGVVLNASAPNGILGRAVIVHSGQDDLQTDPSGNSGAPAACGVIG